MLGVKTLTKTNFLQYVAECQNNPSITVQPLRFRQHCLHMFPSSLSALSAGGGGHEVLEHLEGGPVVGHVEHQLDLLLLPLELVHRPVVPASRRRVEQVVRNLFMFDALTAFI